MWLTAARRQASEPANARLAGSFMTIQGYRCQSSSCGTERRAGRACRSSLDNKLRMLPRQAACALLHCCGLQMRRQDSKKAASFPVHVHMSRSSYGECLRTEGRCPIGLLTRRGGAAATRRGLGACCVPIEGAKSTATHIVPNVATPFRAAAAGPVATASHLQPALPRCPCLKRTSPQPHELTTMKSARA